MTNYERMEANLRNISPALKTVGAMYNSPILFLKVRVHYTTKKFKCH